MASTDPDIVQRAEAALDGITGDGNWEFRDEDGRDMPWATRKIVSPNGDMHELNVLKVRMANNPRYECCWPPTVADARFIAAAPDLVRDLLAELGRQKGATALAMSAMNQAMQSLAEIGGYPDEEDADLIFEAAHGSRTSGMRCRRRSMPCAGCIGSSLKSRGTRTWDATTVAAPGKSTESRSACVALAAVSNAATHGPARPRKPWGSCDPYSR